MADLTKEDFRNLSFLTLGYASYAASAFDELKVGSIVDKFVGQEVSPIIKACCMILMCNERQSLDDVGDSCYNFPFRVLLEPISSLEALSNDAVSRVLKILGRHNLEGLYDCCAAQALTLLHKKNGSAQQADSGKVRFFSSGCLDLNYTVWGRSKYWPYEEDYIEESRTFSFNAILDRDSFIPIKMCFSELNEEAIEEVEKCRGRNASKFVSAMRAFDLTAMLLRSLHDDNTGVKLELEKALCTKDVLEVAAKAGIEVVPRKVGKAALVQRSSHWGLWEMLDDRMQYCPTQFLETADDRRAVCFIYALSLLIWYYLGARVSGACERLGIQTLDIDLSASHRTVTRKNFRIYMRIKNPLLIVHKYKHLIQMANIPQNLALISNELGPCYTRYLMSKNYDGRPLSENV